MAARALGAAIKAVSDFLVQVRHSLNEVVALVDTRELLFELLEVQLQLLDGLVLHFEALVDLVDKLLTVLLNHFLYFSDR